MLLIPFPHGDEVGEASSCFKSSKMCFKGIHWFPVVRGAELTDV